jgi:hypothetical protein
MAFFMCQFQGAKFPISQIRWLRNRVPIPMTTYPNHNAANSHNIAREVSTSHHHHYHPTSLAVTGAGDQLPQRIISFPENGTLKIEPVEMTDAGDYTCEISTPGHSVESRPAQLFVTGLMMMK